MAALALGAALLAYNRPPLLDGDDISAPAANSLKEQTLTQAVATGFRKKASFAWS